MHQTSIDNMKKAVKLLNLKDKMTVLDVGGRGLGEDRSYYHIFKDLAEMYHIADIVAGENVTHVMPGPYTIPSSDNFYDLIVSGQTLEHVKNPFRLVAEMKRVLKLNGFMILIAPSSGPRHDLIDCWRFMDDAFKAIAEETDLTVVEDWIYLEHPKSARVWNDHVFIGQKR
jgi:SAM-dependent methyltransferase